MKYSALSRNNYSSIYILTFRTSLCPKICLIGNVQVVAKFVSRVAASNSQFKNSDTGKKSGIFKYSIKQV